MKRDAEKTKENTTSMLYALRVMAYGIVSILFNLLEDFLSISLDSCRIVWYAFDIFDIKTFEIGE